MPLCENCKKQSATTVDLELPPGASKKRKISSDGSVDITVEPASVLERQRQNAKAMRTVPPDLLIPAFFQFLRHISASRKARSDVAGHRLDIDLALDIPEDMKALLGKTSGCAAVASDTIQAETPSIRNLVPPGITPGFSNSGDVTAPLIASSGSGFRSDTCAGQPGQHLEGMYNMPPPPAHFLYGNPQQMGNPYDYGFLNTMRPPYLPSGSGSFNQYSVQMNPMQAGFMPPYAPFNYNTDFNSNMQVPQVNYQNRAYGASHDMSMEEPSNYGAN